MNYDYLKPLQHLCIMIKTLITSGPIGISLLVCRIANRLNLSLEGKISSNNTTALTAHLVKDHEGIKVTNDHKRRKYLNIIKSNVFILFVRERTSTEFIEKYSRHTTKYNIPICVINLESLIRDIHPSLLGVGAFIIENNITVPYIDGIEIPITPERIAINKLLVSVIMNVNNIAACYVCKYAKKTMPGHDVDAMNFPQVICGHVEAVFGGTLKSAEQKCIHYVNKHK